MISKATLFDKGHPMKAEVGLTEKLEGHKRHILKSIRAIADLDQMTDAFLAKTVKESLVEPLALQFDKMTKKIRTEQWTNGSMQVARLTIPFTGEADLLQYSPRSCGMTFPRGDVVGKTIHFDVPIAGIDDIAKREIANDIQGNRKHLAECASTINEQVKEFNESLPTQVKGAFAAKLDELQKQHAIFDDLGIPEEPERPVSMAPDAPLSPAKNAR